MKYVKKPIAVEAFQYERSMDVNQFPQWFVDARNVQLFSDTIRINGPHGYLRVNPTDWVIKGVEGELYPCPNSVFRATYEAVEDNVEHVRGFGTTRQIFDSAEATHPGGEEPGAMYKRAFARAAANVDLMRQVAVLMTGADDRAEFERLNAFEEKKAFLETAGEIIDLVRAASR